MKKPIFRLIFIIILLPCKTLAHSTLSISGDIIQILLPISAFGITLTESNYDGTKQFFQSLALTTAISHSLKAGFKNTCYGTRPNGGSSSFPSAHTSSAFQGAFFIKKRYGNKFGIPAISLAFFVGYTRVQGNYHHIRDVIAGTIIAFLVNEYTVDKFNGSCIVYPNEYNGLSLGINIHL